MVQISEKWRCFYCGHIHNSESSARECYLDCLDAEEPSLIGVCHCEMCLEDYKCESDAEHCEDEHKRWNDKYYRDYLVKRNFENLAKAAALPGQKRLVN